MNFKIGSTYRINVTVGDKVLTYIATITNVDAMFISFIDKYKKEVMYNLSAIINAEEVVNNGI